MTGPGSPRSTPSGSRSTTTDSTTSFWERMTAAFSPTEIVELSMCLGSWLSFGRLNHVLGLDTACTLPGH